MSRTLLIVFAKAPVPGRVKTRLVPPLTPEQAAAVHAASLCDVAAQAAASSSDVMIFFDDAPGSEDYFREAFPAVGRQPQAAGNLGYRLADAFRKSFAAGAEAVAVIGSDSPTLPAELLEKGVQAARHHDVVLGPAHDGGYYLVALRRSAWPAALPMFDDIAWSTGDVLTQTLARLAPVDVDIQLLPEWYDVDRAEDLALALHHANSHSALHSVLNSLPPTLQARLRRTSRNRSCHSGSGVELQPSSDVVVHDDTCCSGTLESPA